MGYKGKPQHKLIGLTRTIFGALLNDLKVLEKTGYEEIQCHMVKKTLMEINNHCQRLATSVWMEQIALDYGDFYAAYERWNGSGTMTSTDAIINRRENLKSLTKFRRNWSKKVNGKNRRNIGSDYDIAIFSDSAVELLQSISNEYPNYFRNLKGAIKPYYDRTGSSSVSRARAVL